jgi:MFS family permease
VPPAAARPVSWRQRHAVTAVFLANGLGNGAWAASIPFLKADLGLTDGTLGLALFVFAAGAVLAMLAAAPLAAWLGPARATRVSSLAFSLSLLLPAFATNLVTLAAGGFVVGAANGLMDVVMNACAGGVERRWGRAIMSSFHAAFSGGGLAGAVLGGALAAFGAPWMLVASGVLSLALTAAAWAALGDAEPPARAAGAGFALPVRAALALCLAALLCLVCEGAMSNWTGVYLAEVAGVPRGVTPVGFAAFSAAMLVARLLGDRFVRAWGRPLVVRWGALLAAAGLALAVVQPGVVAASIGFALVGAGLANVIPAIFSAAAGLTPAPAVGVAMAATAGYTGLLAGPAMIGAIAQLAGLRAGMALLVACAVATALTAGALRRS